MNVSSPFGRRSERSSPADPARTPRRAALGLAALLVGLVTGAGQAGGEPREAGGLSFSDELGGFRLLAASGSGTPEDPIVLVEEITTVGAAVLVVRRPGLSGDVPVSPASRVLLVSMVKIVVNRSGWRWSGFDLELRSGEGRPSIYTDGLSFDQAQAIRGTVAADLFAYARAEDEPYDRLRFDRGRVDPGETVRLAFELVDINPRPVFRLAQEPLVLLADRPAPDDRRFAHAAR